jgi:hypothetical protein
MFPRHSANPPNMAKATEAPFSCTKSNQMSTKNVSTKNLPSCHLGVKLGACVVYSISIYKIESTEDSLLMFLLHAGGPHWCRQRARLTEIAQRYQKSTRKRNKIKSGPHQSEHPCTTFNLWTSTAVLKTERDLQWRLPIGVDQPKVDKKLKKI